MQQGDLDSKIAIRNLRTGFSVVKLFFTLALLAGCDSGFKAAVNVAQLSSPVISTSTCIYTYTPTQGCQANGTQAVSLASSSPAACVGTPVNTQDCVYVPPACNYTYTATQACQPNGTQTVSVASTAPGGCLGTPLTTQKCTYVPPTCNYTYTSTQACLPNGTQAVSVTSSSPAGCAGTPVTTQNCHYTPASCIYSYSPTQPCQPNGMQSVSVASSSPAGCAGTPMTTQSCTYVPPKCNYTYTPAQSCQANGTQTVSVTSSTPTGCLGTPMATQSCTYVPPMCNYTYAPTQACQANGTQAVSVASSLPAGCAGTPVTMQSCNYIAPPVVNSFTTSLSNITSGQLVTLSWNVASATTVSISVAGIYTPLNQAGVTSLTLSPLATTTYVLTASNVGGSTTSQLTVTVIPAVCSPNTQQSCPTGNGTGLQTCNSTGSAWGSCGNISSCNGGYTLYGGACSATSQTCSVPNGTGAQVFYNGNYDPCQVASCNSNYSLVAGVCMANGPLSISANPQYVPSGPNPHSILTWNAPGASNCTVYNNGNALWTGVSSTGDTATYGTPSGDQVYTLNCNYPSGSQQSANTTAHFLPPSKLLPVMKAAGCSWNGMTWPGPQYTLIPNYAENLAELNRSNCQYLSRSIEGWGMYLDGNAFNAIEQNMAMMFQATKKKVINGFNLPEAIPLNGTFYDPYTNQNLNYSDMCGPTTYFPGFCTPSFYQPAYREYLRAVTRHAMQIGIQDFTFGNMGYQDELCLTNPDGSIQCRTNSIAYQVFDEMRAYAHSIGLEITIGGQYDDELTVQNVKVNLSSWDYSYSATLENADGSFTQDCSGTASSIQPTLQQAGGAGSCANPWYDWNNPVITSQTYVLVHLDWWDPTNDDITRFSELPQSRRNNFITTFYSFLKSINAGFSMPVEQSGGNSPACNAGLASDGAPIFQADVNYACNVEAAVNAAISPTLPSSANSDIWFLNGGQWSSSVSPGTYPSSNMIVAGVGDFSGNGTSGILWYNTSSGDVNEWSLSNGHWSGSTDLGVHSGVGWMIAGVGDFNGDGTDDIFWYNASNGQTDIWLMKNGQWSASVSPGNHSVGYAVAGIGDFNGDGTSDILWYNFTTGDVDEWSLSNGQLVAKTDLGTHSGSGWMIGGIGDFNGDATSDILWTNPVSGQTEIWLMQKGQVASRVSPGAHPAFPWAVIGVGNFSGSGTSGVLWYNSVTGSVDEWVLSNGQWTNSISLGTHPGSGWIIGGFGDFNGNGTDDMLWVNPSR